MPLVVDESRWPIVFIEIHGGLDARDVRTFEEGGDRWLARGEDYATIIEAAGMSMPAVGRLKELAEWMRRNAEGLDNRHRCGVYITDSAMLRGVLRAALKFHPLKATQHVTTSREKAFEFAEQALGDIAKSAGPRPGASR